MAMTREKQWKRESLARKRVMLRLRKGPANAEEIRADLKDLGRFGTSAGLNRLLDELARVGVVLVETRPAWIGGPLLRVFSLPFRVCKVCGCDEGNACVNDFGDGCYWAAPDLCSACVGADGDAKRKG